MSKRISIRLLARILASVVAVMALVGLSMLTIRNGNAYAGEPGRTQRGFSGTGGPTPTPTPVGSCSYTPWSVVPSSNLEPYGNFLTGVTGVSATNVWAVGYAYTSTYPVTLAEKWNGSVWTTVATPSIPNTVLVFQGADAISANDIWAVGQEQGTTPAQIGQPLTEHWNGSAWTVVAQPASLNNTGDFLYSVSGVATNDVWAVGVGTNAPLIEHWNGSAWSVVTPADTIPSGTLYSVVALASNNVWAAGNYVPVNSNSIQTLVMHWNGSSWTQVASPNTSATENDYLTGISGSSPTDIWSVGFSNTSSGEATIATHWNGTAWSIVSTPQLSNGGYFQSVAAVAANNVWAVGVQGGQYSPPLIERWNGVAWNVVPAQGLGPLSGVVAFTNGNAWAVGNKYDGSTTMIEHYPTLRRTTHCH